MPCVSLLLAVPVRLGCAAGESGERGVLGRCKCLISDDDDDDADDADDDDADDDDDGDDDDDDDAA
jgi:hypothetical protein